MTFEKNLKGVGICQVLTKFLCGLLQVLKVNISTQINLARLSQDMCELVLVNTLQRQKDVVSH